MQLHIGLDYDDTVSADPNTWGAVVDVLRAAGHKVTLVSIRPAAQPNQDALAFAAHCRIEAVFTNGKQKAPFMAQHHTPVHIWIDDTPATIPCGTTLLGTAIGCKINHEPVDPDQTLPGEIVLKNATA